MNPERRRRVELLFEGALELPPDERQAWLETACRGDDDLRGEVEALLSAHAREQGILERPDPAAAGAWIAAGVDLAGPHRPGPETRFEPRVDRPVGPYRLLRELGHGGMGTVYLAERADGQFRRRVAIKIIRSGPYTLDLHRRFLAERQILAALDHAHIGRLLDGGFTEDGRPYLVMEFIEGLPIDEHCDRHRLGIDDRLRLFCTAARAVQHAHRNLIVHRDLKPSNILVTADGTPKLLDFGVAKILGPAAALGAPPTRTGLLPMTPEYASPEQVRGDPVTTGTDVYSLGIILYELLCGHRPYGLTTGSPKEIVEAVCERDPPRPSLRVSRATRLRTPDGKERRIEPEGIAGARATTVDRLARRIQGDLDAIVMTALRKEPSRRYASPEALAQDIENHLQGLPVAAHRGGRWYRARKFLRRHRIEASAAAAVAVSLLVGAGTAGWQAVEAGRERDRAEQARLEAEAERDRAQEVTSVLLDLLAASDPNEAALRDTAAARALLRLGLARAEGLTGQPLVQATLLDALGAVHANLEQWTQAEALVRRALTLRRESLGADHPEVARSLNHLGTLARRRGRYAEAESYHREALDLQTRRLGESHPDVAETFYYLGFLAPYQGHPARAEELFRRALEIRRETLGPEHPLVAHSLLDLGAALRRTGQLEAAEATMREGLAMRERLFGPRHPEVANSLLHLADLLNVHRGEPGRAESLYRRALDIQRETLGDHHPALAHGMSNLALLLSERGEHAEAEALTRELLELRRSLFGARSSAVAGALGDLAAVLERQSRHAEAEALAREAVELWRETLGPRHGAVAGALGSLADLLVGRGRYAEAEPLYRQALEIRREASGEHHPLVGLTLASLGRLHTLRGEYAPAESLYRRALDILRRETADAHPDVRLVHGGLAELYERWGKDEEARRYRRLAERPEERDAGSGPAG